MIEIILQAERALAVGMLDQAERLYQQAAELDPRNSIAVVGLARVAVERGDDRHALELTRRALAIDPENAAAQRLTQRLEEVLRYRGEEPSPAGEAGDAVLEPAATPAAGDAVLDPAATPPTSDRAPETPPVEPAPPRRSLLDRLRRRR